MPEADTRLVVYGTLAPGRPNHHELAELDGQWSVGTVRGDLVERGWGASLGYPAIILNSGGSEVQVQLFESAQLPQHWSRLDAFEGPSYQRVVTKVATPAGEVEAWIYELASSGSAAPPA